MPEKTLLLPRLGETMTEGTIIAWQKQPGETFRRGDPLLELETDKMAVEIPALEDGEMVAHLVAAGDVVAIDAPIATVRGAGEAAGAPAETPPAPAVAAPEAPAFAPVTPPPAPPAALAPPVSPPPQETPRPRSSPSARRLAQRLGIALTDLRGSGPRGRVTSADVQGHQAANGRATAAAVPEPPSPRSRPSAGGKDFVEVGSHGRIHYQRWTSRHGTRRGTVLLVHGFAGDLTTWGATADFLANKGYDVIAVDLPGHGATEATEATTPAACAEVLLGALEGLGLTPSDQTDGLHLVGLSLGGAVATHLARSSPVGITSLTLLAPVGLGTEINQGFLDGLLAAETIPALERELRKTTARPQPYSPTVLTRMLATLREEPRRRQLRTLSGAFARDGVQQVYLVPELATLTVPVRVLFGRQDCILRWQEALDLPGQIALHLFDTGHMPHWEDPRAVLPLLARFPTAAA